ncbi:MAG TPA: hypothetical protein VND93_13655 [Myxococcales bacterium]|nr:hypothetical protein [Myxococcales bacterium]
MRWAAPVALALGLGAVAVLSAAPPRRPPQGPHEPPLLPRPELLHALFAAQQPLVADYYWVRTTEATGRAETVEEYRDIADYANLVADLDPGFAYLYVFAGAVIPVNLGREQWVNTRESTAILRRGVERFPRHVFLRILLAHNLTYFDKDYRAAADLLAETARLPGAPRYLAPLAARMYSQAGAFDAGRAMAESLAENATDPDLKKLLQRRRDQMALEEQLQKVDRAVASFRARQGRLPFGLEELVVAGDLDKLPVDPLGGQISLDDKGRASSSSTSHLRLKLFDPRGERRYVGEEEEGR